MNTMRVFLHNLLWEQDPKGFQQRIDTFLTIAARHHIRPSVCALRFLLGSASQARAAASAHSRRAQLRLGAGSGQRRCSPIRRSIRGSRNTLKAWWARLPTIRAFSRGICGTSPTTATTTRTLQGEPKNKNEIIAGLLPQVFAWARSVHPTQPLTSGLWHGDWTSLETMPPLARIQIEQSDIISFHNYGWPEDFEAHVKMLAAISSAPHLHRVHGAQHRQHFRHRFCRLRSNTTLGPSTGASWPARARPGFPGIHGSSRM